MGKEELLLALTRMRYGNSCLPFELEVEAEQKLKQSHEEAALKLLRVFVGAWRLLRTPPPGYTDPGARSTCRGTWARVTIDQFRHLILRTFYGHMVFTNPTPAVQYRFCVVRGFAYGAVAGAAGREDDLKRFKTAVTLARLWAVGVVIRNSRLTRHQSWHAQVGLGRIVALYHCSSTSYQIR